MIAVQPVLEQRVILHNISWETYARLLAEHESSSAPRFTYDRGELETKNLQPDHEDASWMMARVIETIAEHLDLEFRNLGSTTLRREDLERGVEPDSCFYINNEATVRGKRRLDLMVDPPQDIVVDIDLTHSSMYKKGVFAALGVPEVWRDTGERLTILALDRATYVEIPMSRQLPGVTADAVTELVAASMTSGRIEWLRHVREWARELSA